LARQLGSDTGLQGRCEQRDEKCAEEQPGQILRATADAGGITNGQQHVVCGDQQEEIGKGPEQRLAFPRLEINQLLDERFHKVSISAPQCAAPLFRVGVWQRVR
jgi:hypothetical protein